MKPMTQYQANDGSVWDHPAKATERDNLIAAVSEAMLPLGTRSGRLSDGKAYQQHDPMTVQLARGALLGIARKAMPYWAKDKPGMFDASLEPSCNLIGRILSDNDATLKPISAAWRRICCIDSKGREWEQPYFVDHPQTGAVAV